MNHKFITIIHYIILHFLPAKSPIIFVLQPQIPLAIDSVLLLHIRLQSVQLLFQYLFLFG